MKSLNSKAKFIFLSPHFDDAVLSCGGLIAKAMSQGCLVNVITFYTKQTDPSIFSPKLRKIVKKLATYKERKEEDMAALDLLGAKATWLCYSERIYRQPWLKSLFDIFKVPEEADLNGFDNIASIKEYLVQLFENNPEAYFFAPLGIGNHFDHVELFLACIVTAMDCKIFDRFFFYEDFYSIGANMRKRHFISKHLSWRRWQTILICDIKSFFIDIFINSQARGLNLLDYLPEEYKKLEWSLSAESIETFINKKIEAVSKYTTQVKQMGGIKLLSRFINRLYLFWGNAEPYWTANYNKKTI
ncbi:MAG: PIG-L deacetylase family protein [Candidatus Humimicrobiaceae bacterium]